MLHPFINEFEARFGPKVVSFEENFLRQKWAESLEERTNIKAGYWILGGGLVAVASLNVLLRMAAGLVSNLIGLVYPAYASMRYGSGIELEKGWREVEDR